MKSCKVADLGDFWKGQKEIVINDPNLLACEDRISLLQQLIDSKVWININQGLDIRFMDEEAAYMVNQLRLKMLHFAWDDIKQSKTIVRNLIKFKQSTEFDFRKLRVYVLTNFDTTEEQDLYRIYKLKELGYDPYLMIFNKPNAPKRLRKMQRWVNNKFIFRSGQAETFEDYLKGVKS